MNSQPYGLAKQFFRTSIASPQPTSRPSSLNTTIYGNSHISHSPSIRLDIPSPSSIINRELPRISLESGKSQSLLRSGHNDYYGDCGRDDTIKTLQARIEDLSKRVGRNTEDIRNLKEHNKTEPKCDINMSQQLNRVSRRHEGLYQECMMKIKQLREQLSHQNDSSQKHEADFLQKLSPKVDERQLIKIKAMLEERVKQETAKIKLIIENSISKVSHQIKWELDKTKTESMPFKSKLKYPFQGIRLVYREQIEAPKKGGGSRLSTKESIESPREGRVLMHSEQVYYVDQEGFLLDENSYYILDSEEKMIRLSTSMLQKLRREGLLTE